MRDCKQKIRSFLAGTLIAIAWAGGVAADAVSVSPTQLLVPAGGSETTLTVRADGTSPAAVQVRIYRWDDHSPAYQLYETRDVVVSPPISELHPRQELTVRVVRTSRTAVQGRECYRVLVDRLPDPFESSYQVALRIRHSVPLCFTD